jgi:hypothetical protein
LRYSGILQIHHCSNSALEFHPRTFPAQCPERFCLVTVHPEKGLDPVSVPENTLEESIALETLQHSLSTDQVVRRRYQIPAPRELLVSLQAHVKQVGGICPLCDLAEEEDHLMRTKLGLTEYCPPFPLQFPEITDYILN